MSGLSWIEQCAQRIAISEGSRAMMYHDSLGVPTIGIGFNLQREDAEKALAASGCADPAAAIAGTLALTPDQIQALFDYSFAPIVDQARSSLQGETYDHLADARRFVICDLVFNLGLAGWMEFSSTRDLLGVAQEMKDRGDAAGAHYHFSQAADHLAGSAWYDQVGDRAKRDVAMLRSSAWCNPTGDGSDVA